MLLYMVAFYWLSVCFSLNVHPQTFCLTNVTSPQLMYIACVLLDVHPSQLLV